MRTFVRLVMLSIACGIAAGCSNPEASSPLAPTPATTPAPVPPPAPSTFTLTGRVGEAPPTAPTGIRGAVVTIGDGANAGRSAVTDPYGFYAMPDLQSAVMTIAVSAEGFVGASRSLEITNNTTSNFELAPVPEAMTHTLQGDIAGRDGTCSDGVSNRPCRIVAIPIHNAGPIDATLTWNPSGEAQLDLTLFQTGNPTPIVRSAGGSKEQRISAHLTVPSTYELRITYAGGTADARYTLKVTHLN